MKKVKGKAHLFAILAGILLLFLPMSIVKAEELPDFEGQPVAVTGFEIWDAPKTEFYDCESYISGTADEIMRSRYVVGLKYRICYTIGETEYEISGVVQKPDDKMVEWVCIIEDIGYAIPITFEWKKVEEKRGTDVGTIYVVDDKDNAIVCRCGDKTAEIPVKFYCGTPVASLELVKNTLEKGVYDNNANSVGDHLQGMVVKINYLDGSSKEVTWQEDWRFQRIDDAYNQDMEFHEYSRWDSKKYGEFEYMGVTVKVPYKLLKSPIKELQLVKEPKKTTYGFAADREDVDLYGLKFYIIYRDGSKQLVSVNKHTSELAVKLKKADALDLRYTGDVQYNLNHREISMSIHDARLSIPTKVKISSIGKSKKITENKNEKITVTEKASTKLFKFIPEKTGKYSLAVDGQWMDAVSGKTSCMIDNYIFTKEGSLLHYNLFSEMKEETEEFALKKGKTYYVCIDTSIFNHSEEAQIKLSLKVMMAYKGELEDPHLEVNDITAAYSAKKLWVSAGSDSGGRYSYESSNKKVAVVSDDGKITIKGMGTTKITVKLSASGIYKAAKKTITLTVVPDKMELSSVKSTKAKQMTIRWKSQKKATGYVIEYSTDAKFKKNVQEKVIVGGKKAKTVLKNLEKGKKYYVRIKAYILVDNTKVFGKNSKIANVKVK